VTLELWNGWFPQPKGHRRWVVSSLGSVLLAFDTAIGTGSLLVGSLGDRVGLGTAFLVLAGLSALAVPAFLLTRRLLPETAA